MTLKIIVENDRNQLSSFELDKNLVTVGRSPSNDIVLDERNISRHHFQLEVVDDRIIIEDMGSYNSTVVNDKEIVRKTEIFPGDIIIAGDFNIYIDETDLARSATLEDKGPIVADENLLLIHNGPNGGRTVSLQAVETIIGSHAGADVFIPDSSVPEIHSKVIFDGNMFLYVKGDYSSQQPLTVNGQAVSSIDMRNGDIISVAGLDIEFIEAGQEYNPYPYLVAADEERRKRLLKEIEEKKIRSVRDDDEITEITRRVKQAAAKAPKPLLILALAVGILLLLLAVLFFFRVFSSSNSQKSGLRAPASVEVPYEQCARK